METTVQLPSIRELLARLKTIRVKVINAKRVYRTVHGERWSGEAVYDRRGITIARKACPTTHAFDRALVHELLHACGVVYSDDLDELADIYLKRSALLRAACRAYHSWLEV